MAALIHFGCRLSNCVI